MLNNICKQLVVGLPKILEDPNHLARHIRRQYIQVKYITNDTLLNAIKKYANETNQPVIMTELNYNINRQVGINPEEWETSCIQDKAVKIGLGNLSTNLVNLPNKIQSEEK